MRGSSDFAPSRTSRDIFLAAADGLAGVEDDESDTMVKTPLSMPSGAIAALVLASINSTRAFFTQSGKQTSHSVYCTLSIANLVVYRAVAQPSRKHMISTRKLGGLWRQYFVPIPDQVQGTWVGTTNLRYLFATSRDSFRPAGVDPFSHLATSAPTLKTWR